MSSQSIEFQKILKNYDSSENIRNSFRMPIKGMDNIHVLINNIQYNVLDISPEGVAIILEDNAIFTINEIIENCELCIHDQVFHSLKARIVHSSLRMEMSIQCGVQWIDLDRQISDQLNQIIITMKNQLLKKSR